MKKRLMILGASVLQLPGIEQAKEMGYEVVAVDMDPNAIGFRSADICLVISTIDIPAVVQAAKEYHVDGVMTLASDMPMRTVAAVAKECGLVGIDMDTAIKATNKAEMREALAAGHVPIPEFHRVRTEAEYLAAIACFDEKCIVKPADNSGSRGVYLIGNVKDEAQVAEAYTHSRQYRENVSVAEITEKLGGGLYLSTQVINIPRGSGLGTSSILAGACVKAIYEMMGRQLSDDELYNRVLCMEQIMSTGGGWQDQVGGLAPGIKMVTSAPAIQQRIECKPCSVSEATMKELNERFCLIYTGQRRLARNLLRDVIGRYISGNPDAVEVLYEIQRMAVLMRFELEKGNVDGFARLLTEHWELSKRLDAGSTNTCIDLILNTVSDLIDGQMICGAGGGGFLQVVLKKGVTADMLRARLREVYQDSGVDVWQCEFA